MNRRLLARASSGNGQVQCTALAQELAWATTAIDDTGAWSELLTCWLWEIAADSVHHRE